MRCARRRCPASSGSSRSRTTSPDADDPQLARAAVRRRARRRSWSRRPRRCSPTAASALSGVELGDADARGRVHPPDREDAAMSAAAVPAPGPRRSHASQARAFTAVLRRDLLVTWYGAAGVPRPGDPAAAVPAVRVRQGARLARLHAARLLRPAVPRAARADRGDHRHADAGVPARDRVRLDQGDRGSAARADVDRARRRREGPVRRDARAHRDAR